MIFYPPRGALSEYILGPLPTCPLLTGAAIRAKWIPYAE